MADLQGLDEAALKNKLNGASTYEERAAIRKALRELKASSTSSKAAPSTTGYRRPGFQQTSQPAQTAKKVADSSVVLSKESKSSGSKKTAKPQLQPDSTPASRTTQTAPSFARGPRRAEEVDHQSSLSSTAGSRATHSLADGISHSVEKTRSQEDQENRVRSPAPAEKPSANVDEVQEARASESPTIADQNEKPEPQDHHQVLDSGEKESESVELCKENQAPCRASPDDSNISVEVMEASVKEATESPTETKSETNRSRHQTGESVSSCGSLLDGEVDEEEEAIERQIQATLNYDERKRLRAKLRQLRKNKSGKSTSSISAVADADAKAEVKRVPPASEKASVQRQDKEPKLEQIHIKEAPSISPTKPQDETDLGQEVAQEVTQVQEEVEPAKEEIQPAKNQVEPAKQEGTHETYLKSPPCAEEPSDDSAVVSQNEDDASSQTSHTSSVMSDSTSSSKRPHWTSSPDEGSSKSKDSLSTALSQSEGVSDFRAVLRSSSPMPQRKDKAKVEQRDFRSSLKRSDHKKKDVVDKGPRQEDFRSNLRRSVKTNDKSSAAPRQTTDKQEDFRGVLKKTEKSESDSPEQSPRQAKTDTASDEVKKAPPPVKTKSKSPTTDVVKEHDSAIEVSPTAEENPPAKTTLEKPQTNGHMTNGSLSSPEKTSTEKLLDPWDPSLSYEERVEARRRLREAKKKGLAPAGGVSSSPSSTPSHDRESYEERRKKREEEKRREEEERRKQRQQFTQQLGASSPGASPSKNFQRSNSGVGQLLEWCRRKTVKYENVEIKDFRHSWKDGLAFAALMHNFCPADIPYEELSSETRERNFQLAFQASEKAGLPAMLDVEDMMCVSVPDEKSIITYIATIYKYFT